MPEEINVRLSLPFDERKVYRAKRRTVQGQEEFYVDFSRGETYQENGEGQSEAETPRERRPRRRNPATGARDLDEELVVTLPLADTSNNGPGWKTWGYVPLSQENCEYRNCQTEYRSPVDFFGGADHHVTLEVDAGRRQPIVIETYPAGTSDRFRKGVKPLFDAFPKLKPDDKLHFERIDTDKYRVWVEKKKGRPRTDRH